MKETRSKRKTIFEQSSHIELVSPLESFIEECSDTRGKYASALLGRFHILYKEWGSLTCHRVNKWIFNPKEKLTASNWWGKCNCHRASFGAYDSMGWYKWWYKFDVCLIPNQAMHSHRVQHRTGKLKWVHRITRLRIHSIGSVAWFGRFERLASHDVIGTE